MQRQLMDELIAWKSRSNRKPLLLKGARQTGKTWLLNEFAGQQYQNVIRFDFMLEPGARSLFDGSLDPKRIISQIELLRGQTITPTDTLIIFDEIQEAPRGITSLKYFNELAPEYHIVAAGSYMGLALRRENESFPVGKIDQLTMRPMGFAEFVRAVDGGPLADAVVEVDGQRASAVQAAERLSATADGLATVLAGIRNTHASPPRQKEAVLPEDLAALATQAGINAIPAIAFVDVGVQLALHFDGDEVTEDTPGAPLRPSLVRRHRWDSLTRAGPTA